MSEQKDALLQTAVAMLQEGDDPDTMTVRGIASRAGVTFGLVNYYFGSKEALLSEAVSELMRAKSESTVMEDDGPDPVEQIRAVLVQNAKLGMKFPKLLRFMVKKDIESGGSGVIKIILPLLRKKYFGIKTEEEILLTAAQIVLPLQVYFMNPSLLQEHLGWDILKEGVSGHIINILIDNVIS